MSMKRFGTQLRELLAGLNKNEKLTPTELIERVNNIRNGGPSKDDTVIQAALKNTRFVKKVMRAYRRSAGGRVVLYARRGEPMVMTLERWGVLHETIKNATVGLKRYHENKRRVAAK